MTSVFLSLMLVLGAASAQEASEAPEAVPDEVSSVPAEAPEVPEAAAPPTLDDAWASLSWEALLAEAVARRRTGDFEGSLRRLVHLRGREATAEVLVQEGITLEYLERFDEALADYDAALAQAGAPDGVVVEASFRRALVLEDLGRHAESAEQVKALQERGGWTPLQATSLELARGVDELAGKKARKGLKRIERALASLEAGQLPWMEAKARTALARHYLGEASELPLEGNKKAGRNLVKRTGLMVAAEQEIIAVAVLGEPEYILDGLMLLGDAYLSLYDDMIAAPPPKGLDAEQQELYRTSVADKAAVLPAKALRYYDEGVQVGVNTAWRGAVLDELRARRDGVSSSL